MHSVFRCLFERYFTLRYLTLYPLNPFSPGLPTGRNRRWQLLLHQQSSCQPVGEHLVPGGGGLAVGSVRRASGRSVESATSVKTWRSSVGRAAWSSPASWGSALQWVSCSEWLISAHGEGEEFETSSNVAAASSRNTETANKINDCLLKSSWTWIPSLRLTKGSRESGFLTFYTWFWHPINTQSKAWHHVDAWSYFRVVAY